VGFRAQSVVIASCIVTAHSMSEAEGTYDRLREMFRRWLEVLIKGFGLSGKLSP
jgi:hypothetical protein